MTIYQFYRLIMSGHIAKVYGACEEESRKIWASAKPDLVKCFAYYFHSILAVAKVRCDVGVKQSLPQNVC